MSAMAKISKTGKGGGVDAGVLFYNAMQSFAISEIADLLAVRDGTVQRWIRQKQVPAFYKNDLLRVMGRNCHVGVDESDQFYTAPGVAEHCVAAFHEVMRAYDISLRGYKYVEPSAGCGYFYRLLPSGRRIGIDIDPQIAPDGRNLLRGITRADFLRWNPPTGKQGKNGSNGSNGGSLSNGNGRYAVIGNPPFGRNGKTALDFVFKSFQFADYVGFILPPIFNSTGKGSCHNRLVKAGYALLHTENLKDESFLRPDGAAISVKTVFQVWARQAPLGYVKPVLPSCEGYVDIRNVYVSYKPSRPSSNPGLVDKCDIYIPRSFWPTKPIMASERFSDIPYKDGYGLLIKKRKRDLLRYIKSIDWRGVAHVSTNGSMSLRKDIITGELVRAGFSDHG